MSQSAAFTWKGFFVRLYDRSFDADVFSRAAQVAFYFSFALFPLLYFLVSLFGLILVSSDGLKNELFIYLNRLMPNAVFILVRTTVEEIIANSSGGKATIGLLVTLWSASAGVDALRNALNDVYKIKDSRYWWRTKAQSVVMTFVFSVLAMVVLGGVFYGWQLVQYLLGGLGLEVTSPVILIAIRWISILLLMLLVSEMIYNLLPDFGKFRWVWMSPGSIVSILLWILLTTGFRLYLSYFNSYDKAYGSLGAVIIMMLWLYFTALTLLIGGVINSVLNDLNLADPPE